MSRLAPSIAILIAASAGFPAYAADPGEQWDGEMDFRSSYQSYEPKDWNDIGEQGDGIHIETGLRYWYSMGSHTLDGGTTSDTAHSGEVFLRVNDDATATYASGNLGYSSLVTRDFGGPEGFYDAGQLQYGGADFGWTAFNDGHGNGVGALVGYQYWSDTHDTSSLLPSLEGGTVPYDDATGRTLITNWMDESSVEIHALRLGLQGSANFNNFIDFRAEVAAVPYAQVTGTIANEEVGFSTDVYSGPAQVPYDGNYGNISSVSAIESTIDGWGYGGMAEAFVGFHPTENLVFRLGGRAWYVQGTADATATEVLISDPVDADADPDYEVPPVVSRAEGPVPNRPFSFLRYGLLAEITYSF